MILLDGCAITLKIVALCLTASNWLSCYLLMWWKLTMEVGSLPASWSMCFQILVLFLALIVLCCYKHGASHLVFLFLSSGVSGRHCSLPQMFFTAIFSHISTIRFFFLFWSFSRSKPNYIGQCYAISDIDNSFSFFRPNESFPRLGRGQNPLYKYPDAQISQRPSSVASLVAARHQGSVTAGIARFQDPGRSNLPVTSPERDNSRNFSKYTLTRQVLCQMSSHLSYVVCSSISGNLPVWP